jgi:hypothetical protein
MADEVNDVVDIHPNAGLPRVLLSEHHSTLESLKRFCI